MLKRTALLATLFAFFTIPVFGQVGGLKVYSDLVEWHDVDPGGMVENAILVENTTKKPITVQMGVENYLFGVDRDGHDNDHNRSLNDNITVSPRQMEIPPNTRRNVKYSVSLPDSAKGSYWSLLTITPRSGNELEKGGVTIKQKYQWGINVVATAEGGRYDFNIERVETLGDDLLVTIRNTGTNSVRADFKLEAFDDEGNRLELIEGQQHLLHPNTSLTTEFDVSGIPAGKNPGLLLLETDDKTFGIRTNFITTE